MAKKKKRKYVRSGKYSTKGKRANATTRASTKKKKRKYTKRAEAKAPRKYTKRADRVASFNLPELLRSGLEQVQQQIKARTEELIQVAVGTEAPSVSAMLTEAAKQAENDVATVNLLLVRSNLQAALGILDNLDNRPKRGRKVKAEKTAVVEKAESEDEEVDSDEEEDSEDGEGEIEGKKSKKDRKVVSIKKKKLQKKAASILRKKQAEA